MSGNEMRTGKQMIVLIIAALIFTFAWYLGYYMGVSDTVQGKKGYVCR